MENPATWNYATQVISDALGESDRQVRAGIFGHSPARIIHDALEKEGLLKSAPGEGSEGEINAQRNSHSQAEKGSEGIPRAEAKGQRVEQSSGLERSHERSSQIGEGSELPVRPLAEWKHEDLCHFVFRLQCELQNLKAALSSPQPDRKTLSEWKKWEQEQKQAALDAENEKFHSDIGKYEFIGKPLDSECFYGYHAPRCKGCNCTCHTVVAPPVTAEGKDRG